MPNWCTNELTITGDTEDIKAFIQDNLGEIEDNPDDLYYSPPVLDFSKAVPMPDTVFQGDLGKAEREKYGTNNWYDWSIENWGTKWNVSHIEPHVDVKVSNDFDPYDYWKFDEQKATLTFDTAWSPPLPWLEVAATKYPGLYFRMTYIDDGMFFEGLVEGQGVALFNSSWNPEFAEEDEED